MFLCFYVKMLIMRCDLHSHTWYSFDSLAKPEEMVKKALEREIDCLAITDHEQVKGAFEAIEIAKGKPILIIPGIEIKSREGDILGLNIKKIIPNGMSAKETIKRIKEEGGMAIIPHPFGWSCSFKGNLKNLLEDIDGIEVLNSSIFGQGNKIALDFARKFNLPFTCGSDAHEPSFVGRAYLEIPGENLSLREVLEKIKKREGKIMGSEAKFFEKIIAHSGRNLAKIFSKLGLKPRKN